MQDLDLITDTPITPGNRYVYLRNLLSLGVRHPTRAWTYLSLKRRSGFTSPESFWRLLCTKMGSNDVLLDAMEAVDYRDPEAVMAQITDVHAASTTPWLT